MDEQISGQICLDDYQIVINDGWNEFHEHCAHRMWHKQATETEPEMWMCGYANGHLAKGWNDWIPCTKENCYIVQQSQK